MSTLEMSCQLRIIIEHISLVFETYQIAITF
jgi:hypothetical protein